MYVSTVGKGSLHDSKSWNDALAYPPVQLNDEMTDCVPRADNKTFIQQLQETYPLPLRHTINSDADMPIETSYQPCISGDKAYPGINLPDDWHLYVTMTAEVGVQEKQDREDETNAELYNIEGDNRRHKSPEIAQYRSVVERVIGAMKDFKILTNIALMSQTPVIEIYKYITIIAAIVNYNLSERKTSY